jgi:hypothetical protein
MATLYITEFSDQGISPAGGSAPVVAQPPVQEQTVTISGSSTQSSAFKNNTTFIRLHSDATCSVALGTNPVATTSKMRLVADSEIWFAVPENKSYKVAVISNT